MNMFANFFTWIRNGVKQAILGGIHDAAAELTGAIPATTPKPIAVAEVFAIPAPSAEADEEPQARRSTRRN
jgi:hypothetical protein